MRSVEVSSLCFLMRNGKTGIQMGRIVDGLMGKLYVGYNCFQFKRNEEARFFVKNFEVLAEKR